MALLQIALPFSQMPPHLVGEKMETECFYSVVNVILYVQVYFFPFEFMQLNFIFHDNSVHMFNSPMQSENGSFSAWEPKRAYTWLEVSSWMNADPFQKVSMDFDILRASSL